MASDRDKIYGEWAFSEPAEPANLADRILGARLLYDSKGRPEWVEAQFQSAGEGFATVRMDFPNALFLLSCLKSLQLDSGVPFPDDPRG
ncbi:MAG: hypothetical protein DI555_07070 [Novosphingobium pentaromativorans]|uniref:Uncharacterized protein n=1 Tax=Novosphingobium pentaromativorans TaxID=205844 RepID=A0A2W5NQI9_9SPHN|nr:MAG: hypothetical protein DI555_07070 [Novosphingobium pentaromativorans]